MAPALFSHGRHRLGECGASAGRVAVASVCPGSVLGHDDGDLHGGGEVGGEGADHVVGDVGDPDPGDVAVLGQGVADAGGGAGDLVAGRPGGDGAFGEDHHDLFAFAEAEGEGLVEQVPLRDGVLARVLQVAVDDVAGGPTQRQQRPQRGVGAVDQVPVGGVGGQHRQLVDHAPAPAARPRSGCVSRTWPAIFSARAIIAVTASSRTTTASARVVAWRVNSGRAHGVLDAAFEVDAVDLDQPGT